MKKLFLSAAFLIIALSGNAQTSEVALTAQDYEHAASFLYSNVISYVDNLRIRPHWIGNDRFWFRNETAKGYQFILVNPNEGTRKEAFNHVKLAAALSDETGEDVLASKLPFRSFVYSDDGRSIVLFAGDRRWKCTLDTYDCTEIENEMKQQHKTEGIGLFHLMANWRHLSEIGICG